MRKIDHGGGGETRRKSMVKHIEYNIKQTIVDRPVVRLPEGSQAVSVKHLGAHQLEGSRIEHPECWQVIYLEPVPEV